MLKAGKLYHFRDCGHDITWYILSNNILSFTIITLVAEQLSLNNMFYDKRCIYCGKSDYTYNHVEKYCTKEINLIDAVENFKNWQIPENTIIEFLNNIKNEENKIL